VLRSSVVKESDLLRRQAAARGFVARPLDLIGLPPTSQEIESFEPDKSPRAFENVMDRRLASSSRLLANGALVPPLAGLARYAELLLGLDSQSAAICPSMAPISYRRLGH